MSVSGMGQGIWPTCLIGCFLSGKTFPHFHVEAAYKSTYTILFEVEVCSHKSTQENSANSSE